jgi:hypothetical protein
MERREPLVPCHKRELWERIYPAPRRGIRPLSHSGASGSVALEPNEPMSRDGRRPRSRNRQILAE